MLQGSDVLAQRFERRPSLSAKLAESGKQCIHLGCYNITMKKHKIYYSILVIVLIVSVTFNICFYIRSAKNIVNSDSQAVELVKEQSSEVTNWIQLLVNKKKTDTSVGAPSFAVEKINDHTYQIHAYENKSDHAATFGRYYVDTKSGIVSEQVN